MQRFINKLMPFILIGIATVAFAFGIILLAYIFFIGAIVGLALFIASWLRKKFFPRKHSIVVKPKTHTGRTFDSDDWKRS